MSASESEVWFRSDSARVYGTLCQTSASGRLPVALLVHGFGSFRDELTGFVELAKRLAEGGIASLRIDMRGCGKSGTRGLMHPIWDWVVDVRQAASFLETIPTIDANRIAVVGMSMGGGVACTAAAVDTRLRVVVALAPVVDGEWWFRRLWTTSCGEEKWQAFQEMVAADRRSRARDRRPGSLPVLDAMAYKPEDRSAFLEMAKKYPAFLRRIRLSALDSAMQLRAVSLVPLIAPRPILIVHSRTDTSVPVAQAEALHAAASDPCRLVLLDESPHCFWIGNQSRRVQEEVTAWLKTYL
jgi:pimeloyl-ACP methyl ester carboxylesterase